MGAEVVLDGSRGEGGGQILRTAMALCTLLGRPLAISNIRAGRGAPGLAAQHLTGVRAVCTACGGTVEGADLGSQTLRFVPGPIRGGKFTFDVSEVRASAGSVGMLYLALLPVLAFAPEPSRIELKGGTHTKWAPPVHYLRDVLLPALARMGLDATIDVDTWGWYPQGGGTARAEIRPTPVLSPLDLTTRPALDAVHLMSTVSNLPLQIARRQQDRARKRLADAGVPVHIEAAKAPSPGKGTFVFVRPDYGEVNAGFSSLGELGKPAETVADEAVDAFCEHDGTDAPVDPHLADQILPYMALAEGHSRVSVAAITDHCRTNVWVIEQFLPVGFEVDEERRLITCRH